MLVGLFRCKTTFKILRLLFVHQRMFHLREIAREIECSPIFVKKELTRLARLGFVFNSKTENKSYWEINRNNPFFEELAALFAKHQQSN